MFRPFRGNTFIIHFDPGMEVLTFQAIIARQDSKGTWHYESARLPENPPHGSDMLTNRTVIGTSVFSDISQLCRDEAGFLFSALDDYRLESSVKDGLTGDLLGFVVTYNGRRYLFDGESLEALCSDIPSDSDWDRFRMLVSLADGRILAFRDVGNPPVWSVNFLDSRNATPLEIQGEPIAFGVNGPSRFQELPNGEIAMILDGALMILRPMESLVWNFRRIALPLPEIKEFEFLPDGRLVVRNDLTFQVLARNEHMEWEAQLTGSHDDTIVAVTLTYSADLVSVDRRGIVKIWVPVN